MIFIILYDLLFWLSIFFSLAFVGKVLQSKSLELAGFDFENLLGLPQSELNALLSSLKGFLYSLLGAIILFILVLFLAICIFKGMIWLTVARKKIKLGFIMRFIVLNLVWFLLWIIPTIIIILLMRKNLIAPFLTIVMLLLWHFTNLLYIIFLDKEKISAIKKAFSIGIKKIYLFAVPYLVLLLVFIIISFVFSPLSYLPENLSAVISAIGILIYTAWIRIYIYLIVKNIIGTK